MIHVCIYKNRPGEDAAHPGNRQGSAYSLIIIIIMICICMFICFINVSRILSIISLFVLLLL